MGNMDPPTNASNATAEISAFMRELLDQISSRGFLHSQEVRCANTTALVAAFNHPITLSRFPETASKLSGDSRKSRRGSRISAQFGGAAQPRRAPFAPMRASFRCLTACARRDGCESPPPVLPPGGGSGLPRSARSSTNTGCRAPAHQWICSWHRRRDRFSIPLRIAELGEIMAAFTYDHIHLRSPDAEATARWYEDMFGAEIVRSVQSDGKPRLDLNLGGVA